MKKVLKIMTAVVVIAVMVIMVVAINSSKATKIDLSKKYSKIEHSANGLRIIESVNVRSEPKVLDDAGDSSNSFGRARAKETEITVSTFFVTNKILDSNGEFYGFLVDELLSTKEGRKAFPRGIKHDPDGIVWINADYIEVI